MVPRIPTISIVVALYLAGLLVGFSAWPGALVTMVAIVGVCMAGLHDRDRAMLGVFGVAGALNAHAITHDAVGCARDHAALVGEVVLDGEARPGAFARGRSVRCGTTVSALIATGHAPAGSTVRVAGDISESPQGTMVRDASIVLVDGPPLLARMRARAGANIDRAFGRDAPLARALLVADMKGLSPEIRDRFAVSGLAHILSISGLHVAIIAIAVELVLGIMRVPVRFTHLLSLAIIVFYVAMLGAPPPAVRSAVMLGARSASRVAQRPTSVWAMLTLGAVQPIVSPRTVLDLGYQLSVVGVAALIVGGVLVRRLEIASRPAWRRELLTGVVCSTIATVASAPLVLWFFGRVSLVGPASNLVAGPLVALLQPMLFLALVLSPMPAAAAFVADACHPLLAALDGVARASASVPGAALNAWATPTVAVLVGIASVSILVACLHDRPVRPLAVALLAMTAVAWSPALPTGSGWAELHMIDVGQGDAVAIRTPHGRWIVFDAGPAWRGGDAGRSTVVPYIARRGGTVDMFVLSHPHTDHVGGAASLVRSLTPGRYVDAAFAAPNDAYRTSLRAAQDKHVLWSRVHPGDSVVVDGVTLTFLAPDSAWTVSLPDPNNASTAVLARVGDVRMLFVGDAEAPEEEWLIDHWGTTLRADILKVGHHGSATSSTTRFLDVVRPRLALISVGAGNRYGHPSLDVIADLVAHHAQVVRTDLSGSIVARTDGRRITVRAADAEWEVPSVRR